MSNQNILGVTQAADRLGITRRGVLAAIERGDLPAVRIGGCRAPFVLHLSDVEAFAAARREGVEGR